MPSPPVPLTAAPMVEATAVPCHSTVPSTPVTSWRFAATVVPAARAAMSGCVMSRPVSMIRMRRFGAGAVGGRRMVENAYCAARSGSAARV